MRPWAGSWLLAALPVAAVVAVDPSGLAPFGPLKWALVTVLVLAAAAALSARRRPLVLARRPARAWVGFLVVVAATAAVGLDPLYAWIGTPERRFGALAWLLCGIAFLGGQQLRDHEARLVAVAAGAALLGTSGWAAAEQLGWEPIRLSGTGERPVATLGSSAYLGAVAALLVPVALGVAVDRRWSPHLRRGAALAAAAGTGALVLSGARAAWIGAVVVAGTVAVLRRRDLVARTRAAGRSAWRVVAVGALAAVAVAALGLATGAPGRVTDAVAERDGGARGRIDEWRVAARVVADHPVTGVGPEGYRIAFGAAVDDAYEQAHGRDPLPDRAHSAVLDVAATTGLGGLAAFAWLLVVVGVFLVRALRAGPAWVAGLATGVLAYAAQAVFLFPLAEIDPLAWLLAGIVVGRMAGPAELAAPRLPRLVPAVAGVAAAAALVAGVLDVAADRVARRTLAEVAAGRPVEAGAAARLRPDAVRYRLVAARGWEASTAPGAHRRALAQLERAAAVSPRDPVVARERSRLLLDQARLTRDPGDVEAAVDDLSGLARRDPRNAQTRLRLGIALDLAGDTAGAEASWLAAERLAPRSSAGSTNLALAYAEAGRWDDARAAAQRALARDPADAQARQVLEATDGT